MTSEYRQGAIRSLSRGQALILIRNHDNSHGKHAILAFTEDGRDVGYLPAHFVNRIARVLDGRRAVTGVVDEVEEFASSGGYRLLGVRITLTTYKQKRKRAAATPTEPRP